MTISERPATATFTGPCPLPARRRARRGLALLAWTLIAVSCSNAGGGVGSDTRAVARSSVGGGTPIFSSGWENDGVGCSDASLSDGGGWSDYNVATYCVASPKISVIAGDAHAGAHAIQKNQYPGDIGDGGGFETVLSRRFSPRLSEWYIRYYVKYNAGYYWHADMKHIITGGAGHAQDIYQNTRPYYTCAGVGPDNHIGRLAIHLVTEGTLWESANVQLIPGDWYLIEGHYRASTNPSTANGTYEAKVNGVPVTWCDSPSPNIRTAASTFDYFKWSTYTNDSGNSAFQAALPISFKFDDFQVCTGGWCGGA